MARVQSEEEQRGRRRPCGEEIIIIIFYLGRAAAQIYAVCAQPDSRGRHSHCWLCEWRLWSDAVTTYMATATLGTT